MRVAYIERRFQATTYEIIDKAETVCSTLARSGYDLTLRQLYYQFVANDLFPDDWTWSWTGTKWVKDPNGTKNADPNYDKLGVIINDARLAGQFDWNYIIDRTRNLVENTHWSGPDEILHDSAAGYMTDRWANQDMYVEVWIEKDALVGVLERACPDLDVPYFSCRGYTSQSEMWAAAQRIGTQVANDKECHIIHLGDHDPSGLDMSRDIHERLCMFVAQDLGYMDLKTRQTEMWEYTDELSTVLMVDRVALNMDQIRTYNPPPNPAKLSDSRAREYVRKYGYESWELDALPVQVLVDLVREHVNNLMDDEAMGKVLAEERKVRGGLKKIANRFDDVLAFVEKE